MECKTRLGLSALFCFLIGCAGSGEGLDANGRPVSGGETPLTANLQSIQEHVFTPICTQCHVGSAAPLGLRLDQDSSYAMLVNAPSAEVPELNRVTPGDPDASYLIQKLEGRSAVGAQMPLGQPPLPASTIAVIRQWIANGAMASSAAPMVVPMQLHTVAVPAALTEGARSTEILVQADGELSASTLKPDSVQLVRSGGDDTFGDGNETSVAPVHIEVRSLDPTVLAIRPATGPWIADSYRLTLSGHGASAVTDREGLPIGEFAVEFKVGGTP